MIVNSYLCASFLVRVLMLDSMDLETVTFEGASLGETLLTKIALVRPHSSVRSRMPLKVKGIVESLPTEGTKVSFYITVTLHVAI